MGSEPNQTSQPTPGGGLVRFLSLLLRRGLELPLGGITVMTKFLQIFDPQALNSEYSWMLISGTQ